MRLWNRRAAVTIGELKVVSLPDRNGLRIKFKAKQSTDSARNDGDATIFNLGPTSRGALLSIADRMNTGGLHPEFIVEAGYESGHGTVFVGTAVKIETRRANPGWESNINAGDGPEELRRVVNKAVGKGATVADAIAVIAESMGVDATAAIADARAGKFDKAAAIARQKIWPQGYAMSGTAQHEMDEIAKTLGFQWSLVDKRLQVLLPMATTAEQAILLNPSTGLIGSPSRAIDAKRPKAHIIHVRSLLQFTLRPGRAIVVESSEISGNYKVRSVEHSGDTHGGEWYSDVEAEAI